MPTVKFKCIRIVYLNGDVDIRHNVTHMLIRGSFVYYGQYDWVKRRLDVAQVFVTPQDGYRRSI
jgi:hypothetical protein